MTLPEQFARFAACVFDFDGTLVDTSKAWENVDRQFFVARGIEYDFETYFALIQGKTLPQVAEVTKKHFALTDSIEDILAEYDQIYNAQF